MANDDANDGEDAQSQDEATQTVTVAPALRDLFSEPRAPARTTLLRGSPPDDSAAESDGTRTIAAPSASEPTPSPATQTVDLEASTEVSVAPSDDPPPQLVPDGVDRNLALARIQERMLGVAPAAVKIGRFVVLEKLGQGAMGIVYLAHDPKLDRKVAIKLVDTSALGSEVGDAHIRLEREAKAAAALGHPNVVTVYDVGTHDDDVFLAMEFVEGTSLTDWMKRERPWRETIATFVEIGRGLAAAHGAGLVHRDFKPDNVLIGADGRPRVADFGLARPTEGWSARDAARVIEHADPAVALRSANALASTGEVCGTPAYMAPEQFTGADVSAASDQFGYCASLFEALFGYRPYKGRSVTELAVAVIENNRQPLPSRHRVPKAVVETIVRGLEPDPTRRHPSMAALTDRLDQALRARTRNAVLGGGAMVAVLGVALGAQASWALDEQPCDGVQASVEQAWNDERREAVASALEAADLPPEITTRLGTHAQALAEKKLEACEATRVHGEQSDRALSLRMSCFDRAIHRLETAADELVATPSASLLAAVPDALADLDTCDDVEQLDTLLDKFSDDEALSTQQAALLDDFATLSAKVTLHRGDSPDVWQPFAQALVELGETHELPQAAVEGHLGLGSAALARGRFDAARAEFDAALPWATRGMDDMAALVMLRQSEAALLGGDVDAAQTLASQAIVFAKRARHPMRRGMLHAEATMARVQADFARGRFEQSRPTLEALLADPSIQGETAAHARLQTRMSAMLGQACRQTGDLQCAVEHAGRALALAKDAQGTEPLELAGRYANVGLLYADLGDGAAAVAHLQDAAALVESAFSADHPMRGQLLSDIGGIQGAMLDPADGVKHLEAGLAIHEKHHGANDRALVEPLIDLTKTHHKLGNLDAAIEHGRRGVKIVDAAFEGKHPRRADPRVPLGDALAARGEHEEAVAVLEQAVEILEGPQTHPMQLADVRFALARALAPLDGERAGQVADRALGGIAEFEPGKPLREAIEGWRVAVLETEAAPAAP